MKSMESEHIIIGKITEEKLINRLQEIREMLDDKYKNDETIYIGIYKGDEIYTNEKVEIDGNNAVHGVCYEHDDEMKYDRCIEDQHDADIIIAAIKGKFYCNNKKNCCTIFCY